MDEGDTLSVDLDRELKIRWTQLQSMLHENGEFHQPDQRDPQG